MTLGILPGCDALARPETPVAPAASDLRSHFDFHGDVSVEMSGNVAQVKVVVDPEPYRRGVISGRRLRPTSSSSPPPP